MHKVVSWVFKFIGISILLMILLDVSLMIFDAYTTNSRIQAQAALMQTELAKNNYLPDDAVAVFQGDATSQSGFYSISERSRVYGDITFKVMDGNTECNGTDNIGNYGDFRTLVIEADFNPWGYVISSNVSHIAKNTTNSKITYRYTVPCLRYLK